MISKDDIDMGLLDEEEPVRLANGGSEGVGYKYSKYYSLDIYYIPSVEKFVVSKTTINGVGKWALPSLEQAIRKYNRLCEDSYRDKQVVDVYKVPDYAVEEAES